MRGRSATLVLAVLIMAVPAAALDRRERRERAIDVINQAYRAFQRADRECAPGAQFPSRTTFTDAAPSDELLDLLGVFRRRQTEDEAALSRRARVFEVLPVEGVYRRSVRLVRSGGRRFLVYAAQEGNPVPVVPAHCSAALRRRVKKLSAREPRDVRRLARRIVATIVREQESARREEPEEGIFFRSYRADGSGSGGGGISPRLFRRHGAFSSSGRRGSGALLTGLVPDPVASVEAIFSRTAAGAPSQPPKRYRRTIRRTLTVRDNVVTTVVPRAIHDAFPIRMVWRDAEGRVVRRVP